MGGGGRILITGAAGFTGRHACRHFAAAGWEVAALVSPRAADVGIPGAARVLRGDLTDPREAVRICAEARPDAVLHLAGHNDARASFAAPAATLDANVMATVFLLEAVRRTCGCRTLVTGSMLRVPPERLARAFHPYGFSKTMQVMAARAWHHWYKLPVIVAEPSNLIGPGASNGLCGKIARWAAKTELAACRGYGTSGGGREPDRGGTGATGEGRRTAGADARTTDGGSRAFGGAEPFFLSSLTETRDFLDVRDAVSAYELLLLSGQPGEAYQVGTGRARPLADVKRVFDRLARVPLRWRIGRSDAPSPPPADPSGLLALGWKIRHSFVHSLADVLEEARREAAAEEAAAGGG